MQVADPNNNFIKTPSVQTELDPERTKNGWKDGVAEVRVLSNFAAWINLIKMNVGIGVLSMPNAFANAGLALGVGFMVAVPIIFIHSMLLLVRSAQTITRRLNAGFMDYADVVEATFNSVPRMRKFSKAARYAVDTFLLISQVGGFAVYILFVSQNLQTVLASDAFDLHWDYRIYLAISFPITVLICSIRNIGNLSWLMVFANVSEFFIITVVFYYLFREPLPSLEGRDLVAPLEKLPISFGSVMFCLAGVGIVLPLENKMKTPKTMGGFGGVLFNGMSFISLLYIVMGFFGYWVYGNQMRTSGSITLNLPQNEIWANSARLMSSLAILLTNPLQFYIAIIIIFPIIAPRVDPKHHLLAEYSLRYGIILICYGFAAVVPRLDLFVSLTGAITTSALALIFPCILDLLVRYPNIPTWIAVKNGCMITFGVAGSVLGTVLSFKDLLGL